ncbi:MAG TPA: hypothetical protein VLG17_12785 [Pseudomonas sp.]|uniref:hypothetical protein n=1 Tax=Pseudomonas sp. TaxID=306 RepID=UPI002C642C1F|nr:hypothetical protein [Pseudomonas sp.]HSX88858.1 hypothetical protein [Pseudomonas sp.]
MIDITARLFAVLLDPAAWILCAGAAAMIGDYRIAVPFGAALCAGLLLSFAPAWSFSHLSIGLAAGAIQAATGLFLWRLVPDRLKSAMTDKA